MSTHSENKLKKKIWMVPEIKRSLSYKEFSTKALGLKYFYNWCQDKKVLDGDLKTAVRALKDGSQFKKDKSIHAAINAVWANQLE